MIDKGLASGSVTHRSRMRERSDLRGVKGLLEGKEGSVHYEVLNVNNGNVLVWLQQRHPALPTTASGGFGFVEPLTAQIERNLDSTLLRHQIEKRLRKQFPFTLAPSLG